jgi:hypothetical protein
MRFSALRACFAILVALAHLVGVSHAGVIATSRTPVNSTLVNADRVKPRAATPMQGKRDGFFFFFFFFSAVDGSPVDIVATDSFVHQV